MGNRFDDATEQVSEPTALHPHEDDPSREVDVSAKNVVTKLLNSDEGFPLKDPRSFPERTEHYVTGTLHAPLTDEEQVERTDPDAAVVPPPPVSFDMTADFDYGSVLAPPEGAAQPSSDFLDATTPQPLIPPATAEDPRQFLDKTAPTPPPMPAPDPPHPPRELAPEPAPAPLPLPLPPPPAPAPQPLAQPPIEAPVLPAPPNFDRDAQTEASTSWALYGILAALGLLVIVLISSVVFANFVDVNEEDIEADIVDNEHDDPSSDQPETKFATSDPPKTEQKTDEPVVANTKVTKPKKPDSDVKNTVQKAQNALAVKDTKPQLESVETKSTKQDKTSKSPEPTPSQAPVAQQEQPRKEEARKRALDPRKLAQRGRVSLRASSKIRGPLGDALKRHGYKLGSTPLVLKAGARANGEEISCWLSVVVDDELRSRFRATGTPNECALALAGAFAEAFPHK